MALTVDLLTLFPGMFTGLLSASIVRRARDAGIVEIAFTDIREFTTDPHRSVDDRPYGGGPGMVFKPEPVFRAVEAVLARRRAPPEETRRVILTPQGRRLTQRDLREFAEARWLVLLCGHYEGFDERIHQGLTSQGVENHHDGTGFDFEECSIGDYVLSGGEVPAMVIVDGVVRLLPGALGDPDSATEESFEDGLLEYPHYTRPPVFRGMEVPEVLLSGDHGKIAAWRKEQALLRTRERREDLLKSQVLSEPDLREPVLNERRKAVSARTEPGGADALSGRSESERLEIE